MKKETEVNFILMFEFKHLLEHLFVMAVRVINGWNDTLQYVSWLFFMGISSDTIFALYLELKMCLIWKIC